MGLAGITVFRGELSPPPRGGSEVEIGHWGTIRQRLPGKRRLPTAPARGSAGDRSRSDIWARSALPRDADAAYLGCEPRLILVVSRVLITALSRSFMVDAGHCS